MFDIDRHIRDATKKIEQINHKLTDEQILRSADNASKAAINALIRQARSLVDNVRYIRSVQDDR